MTTKTTSTPATLGFPYDATNVSDLIGRLGLYLGRKPTPAELRDWVNTVLGPWAITDEHRAMLAA